MSTKSNLGFYIKGKKVCMVCHSGDCFLLHKLGNFYCCLDVPAEYITKPVREWVCDRCIMRKDKGDDTE